MTSFDLEVIVEMLIVDYKEMIVETPKSYCILLLLS